MTLMRAVLTVVLGVSMLGVPAVLSGQAPSTAAAPATASPPSPLGPDALFTVACATATLEAAPIYITAQGPFGSRMRFINGGVRTLSNNGAHAATNATTQMLVTLRDNPNVRLLFTLADGLYRIVARRSAGIARLADLKGKRVVVPRNTSAHYYLVAMLRSAGLSESDVTLVTAPADGMAAAVARGDADAISMWEPESENAVRALGRDAIAFQDNAVYREFFSVYSTVDVLTDAKRRSDLVLFVRALRESTNRLRQDPAPYFPLIGRVTGHPVEQVARSWEHHAFPFSVPPDLLDSLVDEEQWIAANQQRPARTRQELAAFIDPSILQEALTPAR